MWKKIAAAVVGIAALGAATALPAVAQAPRSIKIGVGTPALNVTYPWLMMPAALGWWKAQGLDVSIIPVSGSVQAVQLLVAGTIDFAEMNASTVIQANATNNVPIRVLMENTVLDWSLVTLDSSPIKSPSDFKGKTIGVFSLASAGNALLKAYLVSNGLDPDNDISLVATGAGAPALQALKGGRVQGLMFWGSMNTSFENQGEKLRYFYAPEWRTMPDFSLVTLQSTIDKNPDLVKTVATAAAKASAFAIAAPDCVRRVHWASFPDTKPSGAPDEAAAARWDMNSLQTQVSSMKSSFASGGGKLWGATTAAGFDKLQTFMLQTKQIEKTLPPATYIVATPGFFDTINGFDPREVDALSKSCPVP